MKKTLFNTKPSFWRTKRIKNVFTGTVYIVVDACFYNVYLEDELCPNTYGMWIHYKTVRKNWVLLPGESL